MCSKSDFFLDEITAILKSIHHFSPKQVDFPRVVPLSHLYPLGRLAGTKGAYRFCLTLCCALLATKSYYDRLNDNADSLTAIMDDRDCSRASGSGGTAH